MKPLRIYRLDTGERLEERAARWPSNLRGLLTDGRLELLDGDTIEPGVFVLLDAAGAVSASYPEPSEHSMGDDLYVSGVHYVRRDRLWSATLSWDARRDGGRCRVVAERVEREALERLDP